MHFFQFPCLWSFISFPLFFPPSSSAFALSYGGRNQLVTTSRWCPDTTIKIEQNKQKKAFSVSFTLSESLCAVQKDTKRQSLQRLSIALASHLLFSHDSDPPTPGISSFPTGDSASLGHIIKSVWGTRSTSSRATLVNKIQHHSWKKYKSEKHTHTYNTLPLSWIRKTAQISSC